MKADIDMAQVLSQIPLWQDDDNTGLPIPYRHHHRCCCCCCCCGNEFLLFPVNLREYRVGTVWIPKSTRRRWYQATVYLVHRFVTPGKLPNRSKRHIIRCAFIKWHHVWHLPTFTTIFYFYSFIFFVVDAVVVAVMWCMVCAVNPFKIIRASAGNPISQINIWICNWRVVGTITTNGACRTVYVYVNQLPAAKYSLSAYPPALHSCLRPFSSYFICAIRRSWQK